MNTKMNTKILLSFTAILLFSAFTIEKKDRITIFMIGDSTMANKNTDKDNQERGWGQLLGSFFKERVIVDNYAKDGRSSLSFINEGRWEQVVSKIKKGDYVFIQFGHNDEKLAIDLHTDPATTFADNLRRFVKETKDKGGYPVLFNSIVRRNFPPVGVKGYKGSYEIEGDSLIDTHGEYLKTPRRIAQEMNIPFIDMNKLSHDLVVSLGREKSQNLYMWIPSGKYEFCPKGKIDNTHLNIYGARVFAKLAVEAISNKVPELARYIRQSHIYNGIPWFDNNGNIVNAHGACIVEEDGKYYLFGEWKSDESNAFPGFSCYSSDDLVNWKFERVVLPMQSNGILGPNRVGERVKVMKCPETGEYIMYMHADDLGYKDPHIGYATSKTIAGEYKFQGPLLFNGEPIRRWDMGTFQDTDGSGYLLLHGGIVYRLSKDYCSAEQKVLAGVSGIHGESPAMFKKNGTYFFLFSNLTSWEKNDNFYYTAPAINGPWTEQGMFTPKGSLTYNSQTTFMFPLVRGNDTIPMFMGDRWSYPHQASAATYVWMPMQLDGLKLSIPKYWEAWDIKTLSPVDAIKGGKKVALKDIQLSKSNNWKINKGQLLSNVKGSTLKTVFTGTQVAFRGESNSHGSYAKVSLQNMNGENIYTSLVDFYSKVPDRALRFKSPQLPYGEYKLIVEVTGDSPVWYDKKKTRFGSDDYFITVDDIIVFKD